MKSKSQRKPAAGKFSLLRQLCNFIPPHRGPRLARETGVEEQARTFSPWSHVVSLLHVPITHKAHVAFAHLAGLATRDVCRVVRKFQDGADGHLLRDDLVALTGPAAQPHPGELREMVFLTNHLAWSAQTIADLYHRRWNSETFFQELKQTLQLADLPGHSERAVKRQVWTALLRPSGPGGHSFTRLFALLRSALGQHWELRSLLEA